jgi:hypothetical protein
MERTYRIRPCTIIDWQSDSSARGAGSCARATAPTRATAGGAAAAYCSRPRRTQAYRRRRVPSEDRRNLGKTLVRAPSASPLCA